MDAATRKLIDEDSIRDVHRRYCRGIDRMDFDLVRTCYHPDGIDDHGAFRGNVEEFIEWVTPTLLSFEATQHFIGNQTVELGGDVAWMESYTICINRIAAGSQYACAVDTFANVRYFDRLERRNDEWRISDRRIAVDMQRVSPIDEMPNFDIGLPRPKRDRSDPSYDR